MNKKLENEIEQCYKHLGKYVIKKNDTMVCYYPNYENIIEYCPFSYKRDDVVYCGAPTELGKKGFTIDEVM